MNKLDGQLNKLTRTWIFSFRQIAERALGKKTGKQLWKKYQSAFPIGYQAHVSPRYALKDILHLERLTTPENQGISLLRPYNEIDNYRLHFYSQQERFLDEYIPVLENMHLRVMDQVQFPITVDGGTQFIRSFTIKIATNQCAKIATNQCAPLSSVNS
jgi:glutamate dehydrogenase